MRSRRELQTWVNAISRWRLGNVESAVGPVDGPDAWDGYRAAIVAQTVLVSMSQGGPAEVEFMVLPQFTARVAVAPRNKRSLAAAMAVETPHSDGQIDLVSSQQRACIGHNRFWKPSLT